MEENAALELSSSKSLSSDSSCLIVSRRMQIERSGISRPSWRRSTVSTYSTVEFERTTDTRSVKEQFHKLKFEPSEAHVEWIDAVNKLKISLNLKMYRKTKMVAAQERTVEEKVSLQKTRLDKVESRMKDVVNGKSKKKKKGCWLLSLFTAWKGLWK